jgi:NhaA family Na+:H+ antiporter
MIRRFANPIKDFLESEASGGIILMVVAALAVLVANSPLAPHYTAILKTYVGGLSVLHWINDALMAVFFLLVGLEIKREIIDGELSTWPRRLLPAIAAAGGMAGPALIYWLVNRDHPQNLAGWAIPAATDIAFALGVLAILGSRVPASLKVFLAALAIIDDLGAVIIIAIFYTQELHLWALGGAAIVTGVLVALNVLSVRSLWPYLALGAVLWFFTHESGVHATIAGVILAFTIPHRAREDTPLEHLEHALNRPVAFVIVPLFGFANAGVPVPGVGEALASPVALGIAAGLFFGKQIGIFGATLLATGLGLAERPQGASLLHLYGVSLICGIGFTMSLFIGLLAFPYDEAVVSMVKVGVLAGSVLSALAGVAVMLLAHARSRKAVAAATGA